MSGIIEEVYKNLPKQKISDAAFEGANIVLYTKDKDFFLNKSSIFLFIIIFGNAVFKNSTGFKNCIICNTNLFKL